MITSRYIGAICQKQAKSVDVGYRQRDRWTDIVVAESLLPTMWGGS